MTHRGLPDSNIYINIENQAEIGADGNPKVQLSSGVSYGLEQFLEWDGWTSPAKRFLQNIEGKKIKLRDIFEPHCKLIEDFNVWFEHKFRKHHQEDFEELEELEREYERIQAKQKS